MILVASEDAGPTEYLCRILKKIETEKNIVCVGSKVSLPIFDKFGITATADYSPAINTKVQFVLTGTCWDPSGLDRKWIQFAKNNKIPCVSVIENWTCYQKRFFNGQENLYPDAIWVNDSIAYQQAVNDGLPINLLKVMGNPVLEDWYLNKTATIDTPRHEILRNWGAPTDKEIIMFISEEYQKDYGRNSEFYPGFDEYSVLQDIVEKMGAHQHLIIKKHPAEPKDKYCEFIKSKPITILERTNMLWVQIIPDFLIGMGSMLLLEAAINRKDVLSYRPEQTKNFIGNEIGATILVTKKEDLAKILNRQVNWHLTSQFGMSFLGSSQNIIKEMENYL